MERYEYRRLKADIADLASDDFVTRLDALGAEGWKLVSTVKHERHGYSHELYLLFVRTVPPAAE